MKYHCTYEVIPRDVNDNLIPDKEVEISDGISGSSALRTRKEAIILHWGLDVIYTDGTPLNRTMAYICDKETGEVLKRLPQELTIDWNKTNEQ